MRTLVHTAFFVALTVIVAGGTIGASADVATARSGPSCDLCDWCSWGDEEWACCVLGHPQGDVTDCQQCTRNACCGTVGCDSNVTDDTDQFAYALSGDGSLMSPFDVAAARTVPSEISLDRRWLLRHGCNRVILARYYTNELKSAMLVRARVLAL